jgi:hypothetical protein
MNEENKFLQVVRNIKGEMVIIDGNYEGLLSLYKHIGALLDVNEENLKDSKAVNLMLSELGGEGLNYGKTVGEDWNFVGHVRICRCDD